MTDAKPAREPDTDLVLAIAKAVPQIACASDAVDLIGALMEAFPEATPDEIVLGISTCQARIAHELGVNLPRWRPRGPTEIAACTLILPRLLLLGDGLNMHRTSAMIFAQKLVPGLTVKDYLLAEQLSGHLIDLLLGVDTDDPQAAAMAGKLH